MDRWKKEKQKTASHEIREGKKRDLMIKLQ
jgi:hypothetical protein